MFGYKHPQHRFDYTRSRLQLVRLLPHPAGTSPNSAFFKDTRNFYLDFTIVVYEKKYFKAYINSQYILPKNNTEYLYLILGRTEWRWKIFSWTTDAPDIHKFPTVHMV